MTEQNITDVAEQKRLDDAREAHIPWKKWGPYFSARQWGTVREDYSDDGTDYVQTDKFFGIAPIIDRIRAGYR